MFLENKYTNCYFSIIYRAKARSVLPDEYIEKHHIIPKSLGGSDLPDNLVKLTAREHFICHLLLVKMLTGKFKHKMAFALSRMLSSSTNHNRYYPSSRIYELARKQRSAAISYTHKGIPESVESNRKRSMSQKGIPKGPKTDEHRKKLSLAKKGKPSKNKGGTTCLKGLTYEEIHGKEKALQLKQDKSTKLKNRQFSDETKKHWSITRKGKNKGGNNSNAKSINVKGVLYLSKKDACEALGVSLYKLNQFL
jgi:hypothetical protein